MNDAIELTKGRREVLLITGGNRGVGKEAALQLAKQGHRVILACRDQTVAKQTAQEISTQTGNIEILVKQLDLNSLDSVRALANDILSTEERLTAVVNNAGALFPVRALTNDGIEKTLSANYVGHFLLTILLLPLLQKSAPARIINVVSMAYLHGHLDFDCLIDSKKGYDSVAAYSNAKLCLVVMTRELARRLKGSRVTVNALNPGTLKTKIQSELPGWYSKLLRLWPPMWSTPIQSGADVVKLVTCEQLANQSGELFSVKCKRLSVTPQAANKKVALKLWMVSLATCSLPENTLDECIA